MLPLLLVFQGMGRISTMRTRNGKFFDHFVYFCEVDSRFSIAKTIKNFNEVRSLKSPGLSVLLFKLLMTIGVKNPIPYGLGKTSEKSASLISSLLV